MRGLYTVQRGTASRALPPLPDVLRWLPLSLELEAHPPLSDRSHCSMLPRESHCSIPHTSAHTVPTVWHPCHSRDHDNSTAHGPGIIRIKPPNSPMQKLLLSSHFQVQQWRHRWMKALGAHSSWAAAGGHASNPVPDWTPPTCPAHVHARTTSPSPKAQSKDPRPLR